MSLLSQYATRSDEFSPEEAVKVTDEMKRKRERKEWTEDDVHRYRLAKAQVMAKKQSDSRL